MSVLVVAGLGAVVVLLLTQFVLAQATVARPSAPPSVAMLRSSWPSDILLPTFVPSCFDYDSIGGSITPDPSARGGEVLNVKLAARDTAECRSASGANITITQAPALASLSGEVVTVSEGRLQFAQLTTALADGERQITLQWHCLSIMCRLTGSTGPHLSDDMLEQMAESFQVIKPEP